MSIVPVNVLTVRRFYERLRDVRKCLRDEGSECSSDEALALVMRAVQSLEIPHLELLEEMGDDTVIH